MPALRVTRSTQIPMSFSAAIANCWAATQKLLSSNARVGADVQMRTAIPTHRNVIALTGRRHSRACCAQMAHDIPRASLGRHLILRLLRSPPPTFAIRALQRAIRLGSGKRQRLARHAKRSASARQVRLRTATNGLHAIRSENTPRGRVIFGSGPGPCGAAGGMRPIEASASLRAGRRRRARDLTDLTIGAARVETRDRTSAHRCDPPS